MAGPVQALQRLSTFEVSGTLIAEPEAKSKRAGGKEKEAAEKIAALAGFENDVFPETVDQANVQNEGEAAAKPAETNERIEINARQIAALFRKKPELAEFIFLEVLSM